MHPTGLIHVSIHLSISPCVYPQMFLVLSVRCWEGNCACNTFSVLKELRVSGVDITGMVAFRQMIVLKQDGQQGYLS